MVLTAGAAGPAVIGGANLPPPTHLSHVSSLLHPRLLVHLFFFSSPPFSLLLLCSSCTFYSLPSTVLVLFPGMSGVLGMVGLGAVGGLLSAVPA